MARNVLIVTQPTDGGVAVCVRQLCAAASDSDHDLTVVSPSRPDEPFALAVEKTGAQHVTMLGHTRRPELSDLRAAISLRSLMRDHDVVHLHSSKAGALGRIAAITLGRRRPAIVFTPHAWSWLVGGRSSAIYRAVERLLAAASDAIVAVSPREASQGRVVLGHRGAQRISVIENGVDLTRFSPQGPQAARDHAVPLIVCVGRLTEQKGQDIALRALAQMKDETARLRFVGDGEARESLAALADSLGVAPRVEWTGAVADVAPHLRAADVVVAPSRWEGMSLVFLETLACGAVLVASEVPGISCLGNAAEVVPREDPQALAAAVDDLLVDQDRRRELQVQARQRSRRFDIRRTVARNLELWDDVAVERDPLGAAQHVLS